MLNELRNASSSVVRSKERYMQPDDKAQPLGVAKLIVLHWRRHSLFAAHMMMALTVVVLLALTVASAENYFADGKGLSVVEAGSAGARVQSLAISSRQ
jgi:hypothetical protein